MMPPVVTSDRSVSSISSQTTPQDSVTLSEDVRSLQSAQTAMANASDVDMERVTALKNEIDSGTFSVSLDTLADSILSFYEEDAS